MVYTNSAAGAYVVANADFRLTQTSMGKGRLQGSGPTAGTLAAVGALGCQHSLLWLQGLTLGALPWRLVLAIRPGACRCPAGGVASDEPGGAGQ